MRSERQQDSLFPFPRAVFLMGKHEAVQKLVALTVWNLSRLCQVTDRGVSALWLLRSQNTLQVEYFWSLHLYFSLLGRFIAAWNYNYALVCSVD